MTAIYDVMIAHAGPIQWLGELLLIAFRRDLLFTRPAGTIAPGHSWLW
jgi:hypothetical protein